MEALAEEPHEEHPWSSFGEDQAGMAAALLGVLAQEREA